MSDMKNFGRLKPLDENAPERMKAFFAFDEGSGREQSMGHRSN